MKRPPAPPWRHRARRLWDRIRCFGFSRACPVCGSWVRRFEPYGAPQRPQAVCPVCGARERHRLAYLYLRQRTRLFEDPLRMLHVAPEDCLAPIFRNLSNLTYVSGDIRPTGMLRMDAGALPFIAGSIDVILCSHMLNTTPDDRSVMRELARVLAPKGWALIQVPVERSSTMEGPVPTSVEARRKAFGDPGVFRLYGPDVTRRLEAAGFLVVVDRFVDTLSSWDRRRWGLLPEDLFVCTRTAAALRPSLEEALP